MRCVKLFLHFILTPFKNFKRCLYRCFIGTKKHLNTNFGCLKPSFFYVFVFCIKALSLFSESIAQNILNIIFFSKDIAQK